MRRIAVVVCCFLAFACRNEPQKPVKTTRVHTTSVPEDARNENIKTAIAFPAVKFADKAWIGKKLAADGTVAEEETAFQSGEPIHLTMWFRESPPGLNASVKWSDSNGKVLLRDVHTMNGSKVVTFTYQTPKLVPGQYRAEGFWGGNMAADKAFEVLPAKPKRK